MTKHGNVRQSGDGTLIANTGHVHGNFTVVSAPDAFRLEGFHPETPLGPVDTQLSSLSYLLHAASHVVPFTGRTMELAQLRSWRDVPGRLSVMLVSGPGGQGKTRLASEFAAASADAGWAVVRARHRSDPQPPLPLPETSGANQIGVLMVVDYAERWPRFDLVQLLQHRLISHAPQARLLLLARPAGYWWKALGNPLVKLGATFTELPLGPLADTVALREVAFTSARDRFAEILGVKGVSRLRPAGSLADDAYELALTLHMSALVAVDAHRRRSPAPRDPGKLSGYLVRREYDHWQTMGENGRISASLKTMARLVALATLTQALPRADAVDLLVSVELAGSRSEAQSLLDDHDSCYPATSGVEQALEPLRPDRLGEDFLAGLLPDPAQKAPNGDSWLGEIPAQLLVGAADAPLPGYGSAVMSMLVEAGRRWMHVRQWYLVPLLRERPRLALAAGGASLVSLTGYADLELLRTLEPILPKQRHVELDSAIAVLTRRLNDHGLTLTTDDAARAKLHDEMADRFSNAGLHAEALSATQEAIVIRRRLASGDPATHEPALANSLGNLGIDLWSSGRSAEALKAMTEAVEIYRRRASVEPEAYKDDLAAELNNLAGSLIALDRYADALGPAMEAAAIFRQLATDSASLANELGSCLRNVAIAYNGLAEFDLALAAIEEAVDNYRHLVRTQPETYEVELADALRSLSSRLSKLSRYHDAVHAAEECVNLSRRAADANPGAHNPGLALGLHSLSGRLWEAGQRERSLAVGEEAVRIQREVTRDQPRANERGLGVMLNSLSSRLLEDSRAADALLISEEAVEIWERLAPATLGTFDPQHHRALAIRDGALSALGHRDGEGR